MKTNIKKITRVMAVVMMMIVAVTFTAPESYAAGGKTKRMTVYNTYVKGNYAYCSGDEGLYKINITTGAKVLLVDCSKEVIGSSISGIHIHKGYIYYMKSQHNKTTDMLWRIKTNGKAKKKLGEVSYYAVSKNKIYYSVESGSHGKFRNRQMKLNGKSKRSSKYKVRNKFKETNKKGYSVEIVTLSTEKDEDGEVKVAHMAECLMLPGGNRVIISKWDDEWAS